MATSIVTSPRVNLQEQWNRCVKGEDVYYEIVEKLNLVATNDRKVTHIIFRAVMLLLIKFNYTTLCRYKLDVLTGSIIIIIIL